MEFSWIVWVSRGNKKSKVLLLFLFVVNRNVLSKFMHVYPLAESRISLFLQATAREFIDLPDKEKMSYVSQAGFDPAECFYECDLYII